MADRVAANLIVGADGSTTIAGSSRALSFVADRKRFHQLRSKFNVILIGGATARNEPYFKTPSPLIVLTHQSLPPTVAANPLAQAWREPIAHAIPRASALYGDVLIEGGPRLLREALAERLVGELFITFSLTRGGENSIEISDFIRGFKEVSREPVEGGLFLSYRLAPSHS